MSNRNDQRQGSNPATDVDDPITPQVNGRGIRAGQEKKVQQSDKGLFNPEAEREPGTQDSSAGHQRSDK